MLPDTKKSLQADQCRAARALLGWSQDDLERESRVAKKTIADFERGARTPYPRTLADLRDAFERVGLEIIDPNGGGAGVRWRDNPARLAISEATE